jgi:hypothetical protein
MGNMWDLDESKRVSIALAFQEMENQKRRTFNGIDITWAPKLLQIAVAHQPGNPFKSVDMCVFHIWPQFEESLQTKIQTELKEFREEYLKIMESSESLREKYGESVGNAESIVACELTRKYAQETKNELESPLSRMLKGM